MNIQDYREIFPNGTIVTHIAGGRGKIKTLENDWDSLTDGEPTVLAIVDVLDTSFPGTRRIPVLELSVELSGETLDTWKEEALEFKEDVGDMREAEPILKTLDRLLRTIQELQGRQV